MKILSKIDLFGYRTSFLIFNQSFFHTNISISLTIIIFFLSILLIYCLGQDFIYRKNPLTLEATANRDYVYILNLTTNDYISAWRIEDNVGNEVNITNILYPILSHFDSETKNIHKIEAKKCSEITNIDKTYMNKIKDYNCFDWNNARLGGSWDDSDIYSFSFALFLCNENGTNCTDSEELSSLLKKEIYISLYYPYINFNPQNNDKAYQIVYNQYYSILSPKLLKVDKIKIHHTIIQDDKKHTTSKIFLYGHHHKLKVRIICLTHLMFAYTL